MTDPFNVGIQPCPKLVEHERGHWGGFTEHQCPVCGKRRRHCAACGKDHHENGWETCVSDDYKTNIRS